MKRKLPNLVFTLVLFLYFSGNACNRISSSEGRLDSPAPGDTSEIPNVGHTEDCRPVQFRYIVTSDRLSTPTIRTIDIFLDERAFSEVNLRALFSYLSDKYSEPADLTVVVSTAWEQLPFPSDCPVGMSNMSTKWKDFDHHWAIFYRRENRLYFVYNPDLSKREEKKVVMDKPIANPVRKVEVP